MNKTDLRNHCNELYDNSIKLMENNESISVVRDSLISVSQALIDYSKADLINKVQIESKALLIINLVKDIREKKSYDDAYTKLTGKTLIKKEIKITKEEPVVNNVELKAEETSLNKDEKNDDDISLNEINVPKNCKMHQKDVIIKKETNDFNSYKFNWDNNPNVTFDDVAGLDEVKDEVRKKVLTPLLHPELYEGYDKRNGGGLLLYGPPGTGKTMIAAAIAREIGAKFCSLGPSDILTTGVGNSEKAVAKLFEEARSFNCAVIFFDEIESLCPVSTHAQHARQIRSELLRQMQGLDSYSKDTKNILYLIAATNKPWDIDPAFVRPGRFGTRVYVGLPDIDARRYMINKKLTKINEIGTVSISNDINYEKILELTNDFNGADMAYLLDEVQQISIDRASETGEKYICQNDFDVALEKVTSSVQPNDIKKILEWREENC